MTVTKKRKLVRPVLSDTVIAATRSLMIAQLNGISDDDARIARAESMLAYTRDQLGLSTLTPMRRALLDSKASALRGIIMGVEMTNDEDNDPESLVQSSLDGRGYAVVLGYN